MPAFQINCITYNSQATSANQVYQCKRFPQKNPELRGNQYIGNEVLGMNTALPKLDSYLKLSQIIDVKIGKF